MFLFRGKWADLFLFCLVFKDKNLAEDIVENDNQHLSNQGFNGVDHLNIVVDELTDNLREASDKDKG